MTSQIQPDQEINQNIETEIIPISIVDPKIGKLFSPEIYDVELEMERILRQEKEKQKLIQQKLKEIEEQNQILAEMEARERRLSREKQMQEEQQIEIESCQQIEKAFEEFKEVVLPFNEIPEKNEDERKIKAESQSKEVKVTTTHQITSDAIQCQKSQVEDSNMCQEVLGQDKQPPQVPWRSSSKHIVKERSFQGIQSPQPGVHLVNVSVSPAPSSSRLSASPSVEILSPNIVQVSVFARKLKMLI